METMTAHEAKTRFPPAPPEAPRSAYAATIVAGLYVLLVLGAPFVVRYGPELNAGKSADPVATLAPRCASAPEFGHACPPVTRIGAHQTVLAATTR